MLSVPQILVLTTGFMSLAMIKGRLGPRRCSALEVPLSGCADKTSIQDPEGLRGGISLVVFTLFSCFESPGRDGSVAVAAYNPFFPAHFSEDPRIKL